MSHLSNVWFKVTDLQVASAAAGAGSPPPTARSTSTSPPASPSTPPGHCHPQVAAAIAEQAERFIHAQVNVFTHDLLEPLAAKLAELTPAGDRHVLLRQLRRRDHRGRGQAGQAGHQAPEHDRVQRQLPRPHPPGDGDDHVEDRLPRRSRTAAGAACSWPRSPTRWRADQDAAVAEALHRPRPPAAQPRPRPTRRRR